MTLKYNFIAENQFGETVFIKEHPRKELLEYLGMSHADKMYIDDKSGRPIHIGYVIGGNWYQVFRLSPWKEGR